ncbi:hypothetical protein AcW1_010303 [Taiwanofungus camphoratus]|nr:hypothetical protein AcW1_010303 [Antrodia cinnamomea]
MSPPAETKEHRTCEDKGRMPRTVSKTPAARREITYLEGTSALVQSNPDHILLRLVDMQGRRGWMKVKQFAARIHARNTREPEFCSQSAGYLGRLLNRPGDSLMTRT